MKDEIKSLKQIVEDLLQYKDDRSNETTDKLRSDDNYLTLRVLAELGYAEYDVQEDKIIVDLDDLEDMPKFTSVKRVRAKFQNDMELYLPPEKVKEKREEAEEEMKEINKWFDDRESDEIEVE